MTSIVDFLIDGRLSLFISGFLFTLSLYHFLLYFQHKDRTYIYYSLYTILIFVYILNKTNDYFLSGLVNYFDSLLQFLNIPIQWSIYIVYFIFVKEYVDLKTVKPKWNKGLNRIIIFYFTALILVSGYSYLANDLATPTRIFHFFVAPSLLPISIVYLVVISKIDSVIKQYIIIGSIFYLTLASTTLVFILFDIEGSLLPFYAAVVIENIFFALGLGAKQKKWFFDKNKAQNAVIEEHKRNLELQEKIREKLDQEVALQTKQILQLTKKNQKEQKRKLALEYSKQTLDLRMRALQTQMNPHFLFNSLNAIQHFIIKNKKEEATYFLSKLSMFIRKILDSSRLKEITLQEEIEIMQLYLEVENIRLKKGIQFEVSIENNITLHDIKIPPLVLQPFIENAIWHGLALKSGLKKITMGISVNEHVLSIKITDNGIGRSDAAKYKAAKLVEKKSKGINLTKERLIAFTSHKTKTATVTFEDLYKNKQASGTKVMIQIPL